MIIARWKKPKRTRDIRVPDLIDTGHDLLFNEVVVEDGMMAVSVVGGDRSALNSGLNAQLAHEAKNPLVIHHEIIPV